MDERMTAGSALARPFSLCCLPYRRTPRGECQEEQKGGGVGVGAEPAVVSFSAASPPREVEGRRRRGDASGWEGKERAGEGKEGGKAEARKASAEVGRHRLLLPRLVQTVNPAKPEAKPAVKWGMLRRVKHWQSLRPPIASPHQPERPGKNSRQFLALSLPRVR